MTDLIPGLTEEQTLFARAIASGAKVAEAAEAVGWTLPQGRRAMRTLSVQRAVRTLHGAADGQRKFTRDMAYDMYMSAYGVAETSREMTQATDSLVKLYGLAPHPSLVGPLVEVNAETVDFSKVSDGELLENVGMDEKSLLPSPEPDST